MPRLIGARQGGVRGRPGPLRAGLVSIACLLRGVPLLFSAAPGTPLRILCIVALDTIHVLRHAQPLSRQRRTELAMFLDFQACSNALWDRKRPCAKAYQALQQRLEKAGLESWVAEYSCRLRALEMRRPSVGGDRECFEAVRSYREAVARLALATITAIALHAESIDEGLQATHGDSDVAMLFRMAMQCQIIDDVIDHREDVAAGLPSFLTACASLPQAIAWTAEAARAYAGSGRHLEGRGVFPLETALSIVTAVTRVAIAGGRRREVRNARAADRRRP